MPLGSTSRGLILWLRLPICITYFLGGRNNFGQLGLNNTTDYSSPKQIGSLTNWSDISLGNQHGASVKTDGTLWTWGANNFGTLGIGNITNYSSPMQVGALTTWMSVSKGSYRYANVATQTNGTLQLV